MREAEVECFFPLPFVLLSQVMPALISSGKRERLFSLGHCHMVPGQTDAINSSSHSPPFRQASWTAVTHMNQVSLPDQSIL